MRKFSVYAATASAVLAIAGTIPVTAYAGTASYNIPGGRMTIIGGSGSDCSQSIRDILGSVSSGNSCGISGGNSTGNTWNPSGNQGTGSSCNPSGSTGGSWNPSGNQNTGSSCKPSGSVGTGGSWNPSGSTSGCDRPEVILPGLNLPGCQNPGAGSSQCPDILTPNLPNPDCPDTECPDTGNTGTQKPDTGNTGTQKPDTGNTGTQKPDTGNSGTQKPGTGNSGTQKPGTQLPDTSDELAQAVADLVNEERAKAGLAPLSVHSGAEGAALVRAQELKRSFSHTRPDGSNCNTALDQAGISYRGYGENIAYGQRSPEEVMRVWMNSSGHRANILNGSFNAIGVGHYKDGSGTDYWCQLFLTE